MAIRTKPFLFYFLNFWRMFQELENNAELFMYHSSPFFRIRRVYVCNSSVRDVVVYPQIIILIVSFYSDVWHMSSFSLASALTIHIVYSLVSFVWFLHLQHCWYNLLIYWRVLCYLDYSWCELNCLTSRLLSVQAKWWALRSMFVQLQACYMPLSACLLCYRS